MDNRARILSVRQPYVDLIIAALKKIEYRSRKTNVRERVYLYASKTLSDDQASWDLWKGLKLREAIRGKVVGSVEIVDCCYDSDEDVFEWMLADPLRMKAVEPIGRPQPGLWRGEIPGRGK